MIDTASNNKLFATTYEDDMVLAHIIPQLKWKQVHALLKSSPLLRGKCKCFDMSQIKEENEKEIKQKILSCYEKDQKLKRAVNLCWYMQTESEAKLLRKYPKVSDLREHIDHEKPKLGIITQLWRTQKEENKALADELFETYLKVKENEGDEEMEGINGELLNRSLLEVIEEVTATKQKIATLEKSLQEKDAQIAELKKQTECLTYTKELKRQVTKMNTNIDKLTKLVEEQQTAQETKLTTIEEKLEQLEKAFVRENRDSSKKQQEVFKNAIDQMNNQVAKQVTKGISSELKSIFEELKSLKEQKTVVAEEDKEQPVQTKIEEVSLEKQSNKEVSSIEQELLNELGEMLGI